MPTVNGGSEEIILLGISILLTVRNPPPVVVQKLVLSLPLLQGGFTLAWVIAPPMPYD